jgi:hypothetical protein
MRHGRDQLTPALGKPALTRAGRLVRGGLVGADIGGDGPHALKMLRHDVAGADLDPVVRLQVRQQPHDRQRIHGAVGDQVGVVVEARRCGAVEQVVDDPVAQARAGLVALGGGARERRRRLRRRCKPPELSPRISGGKVEYAWSFRAAHLGDGAFQ